MDYFDNEKIRNDFKTPLCSRCSWKDFFTVFLCPCAAEGEIMQNMGYNFFYGCPLYTFFCYGLGFPCFGYIGRFLLKKKLNLKGNGIDVCAHFPCVCCSCYLCALNQELKESRKYYIKQCEIHREEKLKQELEKIKKENSIQGNIQPKLITNFETKVEDKVDTKTENKNEKVMQNTYNYYYMNKTDEIKKNVDIPIKKYKKFVKQEKYEKLKKTEKDILESDNNILESGNDSIKKYPSLPSYLMNEPPIYIPIEVEKSYENTLTSIDLETYSEDSFYSTNKNDN